MDRVGAAVIVPVSVVLVEELVLPGKGTTVDRLLPLMAAAAAVLVRQATQMARLMVVTGRNTSASRSLAAVEVKPLLDLARPLPPQVTV